MTLVACVGCGLELKERTGDDINPIRMRKKKPDQKFLCDRVGVYIRTREKGPASQTRPLSFQALGVDCESDAIEFYKATKRERTKLANLRIINW